MCGLHHCCRCTASFMAAEWPRLCYRARCLASSSTALHQAAACLTSRKCQAAGRITATALQAQTRLQHAGHGLGAYGGLLLHTSRG